MRLLPPLALLAVVYLSGALLAHSPAVFSPFEGKGFWGRSVAAVREGRPEEAIGRLNALLERAPDDFTYLIQLGNAYQALGDWKAEAEVGERIRETAPFPHLACTHLTLPYEMLGEHEKAREAYKWCARVAPDNIQMLYNQGMFLERAGRFEEAARAYERLGRSPEFLGARISLARVKLKQGRAAEGERLILAVLKEHPDNLGALALGAKTAWALGRKEEARRRAQAYARGMPR
ncbi:MAG TPA: hypothetical protein DCM05_18185 [Elusimicrobia bacterium]|nr:hypothetical protein [Elusimicrobiota bacterium]